MKNQKHLLNQDKSINIEAVEKMQNQSISDPKVIAAICRWAVTAMDEFDKEYVDNILNKVKTMYQYAGLYPEPPVFPSPYFSDETREEITAKGKAELNAIYGKVIEYKNYSKGMQRILKAMFEKRLEHKKQKKNENE